MQRISQIVGISIGTILILVILITTLLKQKINVSEIKSEDVRIAHIEKFKPKNKWSVSYNIRIENDDRLLKIIPEYYECFDFESFRNEVNIGEKITLKIDPSKEFRANESVVSIKKNGKEYLDINCINEKIKKDKTSLPLTMLGLVGLLTLIYFVQKKLKK